MLSYRVDGERPRLTSVDIIRQLSPKRFRQLLREAGLPPWGRGGSALDDDEIAVLLECLQVDDVGVLDELTSRRAEQKQYLVWEYLRYCPHPLATRYAISLLDGNAGWMTNSVSYLVRHAPESLSEFLDPSRSAVLRYHIASAQVGEARIQGDKDGERRALTELVRAAPALVEGAEEAADAESVIKRMLGANEKVEDRSGLEALWNRAFFAFTDFEYYLGYLGDYAPHSLDDDWRAGHWEHAQTLRKEADWMVEQSRAAGRPDDAVAYLLVRSFISCGGADSIRNEFVDSTGEYAEDRLLPYQLWDEIEAYYREPARHYHTLDHLDYMWGEYQQPGLYDQQEDSHAFVFALCYHDVVYDPERKDNEARSADLARARLTEIGFPADRTEKVVAMILATATHPQTDDRDTAALLDTDLAILGADSDDYRDYADKIRREFQMFSDADYRTGRSAVLRDLLAAPRLFRTEACRPLEAQARENLAAELAALTDVR
ncbi:MAG: hypothetical protein FWH11_02570 [Micrococcales bacterium]|nr:hypothetical protein [Micrococcales bacterium]